MRHTGKLHLGDSRELEMLIGSRETSKRIAKEYAKYNAVQIADETIQQVLKGELKSLLSN
jgi:hypothetical protein